MSKFQLGGRRAITLLAVLALSIGAAACGSDDDDSSEPSSIALEATGDKTAIEVSAPAEAEAGPAEITLTNNSETTDQDGQLAFVAEGEEYTDEQVLAELGSAVRGRPVADWFQAVGGPGPAARGESSTATLNLEAGTYYVLPTSDESAPPKELTKIEVTGDSDDELPDADGTVSAAEYSFAGEGLKSGERTLLLDNTGGTWHHFLATKMRDDATIDQVKEFLLSEGEGGGPPPFESETNAIESTVMDGGTAQLVTVNLEPGKYAFFCFVSDKQTRGPPHVAKGMVSEVEVSE